MTENFPEQTVEIDVYVQERVRAGYRRIEETRR